MPSSGPTLILHISESSSIAFFPFGERALVSFIQKHERPYEVKITQFGASDYLLTGNSFHFYAGMTLIIKTALITIFIKIYDHVKLPV